MTTPGPLRQPIPVGQSILWSPASAGSKRPGNITFPVFLSQAALTAILEHVATPHRAGQGVLGFLLGDACECPETGVSYLLIDVALRLNQAIYGDRTRDVVTRLWDHIQLQLEQQQLNQRIKALKSDPATIEKEAREQLKYARPGEVVYTVPAPAPQPAPANNTAKK